MKKTYIYSVLLFIISISLISCSEESQVETNSNFKLKSNVITASDLEIVGEKHNQALEDLFEQYIIDMPAPEETPQYALDYYTDVFNVHDYNDISVKTMRWNMKKFNVHESSYINDKSFYKNDSIVDLVSKKEKYYFDKLYDVVINDSLATVEETKNNIADIEAEISLEKEFNEEQLITLYSATNIARYSLQFWYDNFDQWDSFVNKTEGSKITPRGKRNFRRVAGADVVGGIAAAVALAPVNAAPGYGQAAYVDGIFQGAVGNSVMTALTIMGEQFFPDWF